MIYTDNLNEFVGIEILKSYCSNINEENDCEYCKLKEFCDCMPLAPFTFASDETNIFIVGDSTS